MPRLDTPVLTSCLGPPLCFPLPESHAAPANTPSPLLWLHVPSHPPTNPAHANPKMPTPHSPGNKLSSAHSKKPHCCSLGLEQVWNWRPLLGPSFWTVLVTTGWSHLQRGPPPRPALAPGSEPALLGPAELLGPGREEPEGGARNLDVPFSLLSGSCWSDHRKNRQLLVLHL